MTIWIIMAGVLIFAFGTKVIITLRRRKSTHNRCPNLNTPKKRFKFFKRFRYLEGIGD